MNQPQETACAARESRMSIAINSIAELAQDLDNVNNRLSAIKGRLLGQFDDIPTPINAEVEPDRSVIDNLDYRLRMLSEQIIQAKSHIAGLEEL
jgi:hypothetical protein